MSSTKRRENELLFDTNRRIAEDVYTRPPCERFDYVAAMIEAARLGSGKLRALLMNKFLLCPDYNMRGLFHRNCPAAYLTASQIASVFCKLAWKAELRDVIYGKVSGPPDCSVEVREAFIDSI